MGAKILKTLMITLISMTIISCGDTDEEKLEKKADNLIEEYTSLANDLNYQQPNTSWSEASLNSYSKKLDRLEAVYDELLQLDADNDELVVYGGYDTERFISSRRRQLAQVRSQIAVTQSKKSNKTREQEQQRVTNNQLKLERELTKALDALDEMSSVTADDITLLESNVRELEGYEVNIKSLVDSINSSSGSEELVEYAEAVLELITLEIAARQAKAVKAALNY